MLKALVTVLLAANGLLAAALWGALDRWTGGVSSGEREPERLQRQIRPEALQLTPAGPVAAAAGAVPAPVSAPASAPAGYAAGAGGGIVAAEAAAPAAAPPACWQAGPFDPGQMAAAAQAMASVGLAEGQAWLREPVPAPRSWWLVMGPLPDAAQRARKAGELRRRNLTFSDIGADTPGAPAAVVPGLLLGRFDDEAAASANLNRLAARGVRTAKLVEAAPSPSALAWLRVPAAQIGQQTALAQLALPAAARWSLCPAAGEPVAGHSPQ